MAENTVKLEIQFESLLAAVSSLKVADKHRLLEMLEDELFDDDIWKTIQKPWQTLKLLGPTMPQGTS